LKFKALVVPTQTSIAGALVATVKKKKRERELALSKVGKQTLLVQHADYHPSP
jgi:hypothetical protein